MGTKYIVFDRDGTLIKHVHYLHNPEQVELLPTVTDSISLLRENGHKLFLHTNQSGVGRGMFSMEDVEFCNKRMIDLLGFGKDIFESICISPDLPGGDNNYRKPSDKFGWDIIEHYGIDKKNLVYVGDSICDLETGNKLGCHSVGVNTGQSRFSKVELESKNIQACIFENLLEVANHIINL